MTRSKGLSDNFAKKRRAARRLRYQQQLLNQDEELPGPSYQNILPHEDNQDNRFTQSDSDSTSDEHDRSNLHALKKGSIGRKRRSARLAGIAKRRPQNNMLMFFCKRN